MSIQAVFLVSIVALVAIFDVIIITAKGKRHSISAWAIRTSYKFPSIVFIVAFGLGFVFGHIFWKMNVLDIYECIDEPVQKIINQCRDVD